MKVEVNYDPDIGRCDDCGSEEGIRRRTTKDITIGGEPRWVVAWLCGSCRGAELGRRANAEDAEAWLEDRQIAEAERVDG